MEMYGISGTDYIPPIPERKESEEHFSKILGIKNDTKRALKFFVWICRFQLFWDGNKRTANIFANRILIKAGAGILFVKDSDLLEFNTLLTEYYNTNEDNELIEFLYQKCIFGLS